MDFGGGVLLVFNQAVTRLDIFCCLHGNVGPSVSLLDFGEELALLFLNRLQRGIMCRSASCCWLS